MHLGSVQDITAFSVKPEPELVLPRGMQLRYLGFENGCRVMREMARRKNIEASSSFGSDENWDDFFIRTAIEDGYTRERAIEILRELRETQERWARERGQPISEKRRQWTQDMYERMRVEATAGLKE